MASGGLGRLGGASGVWFVFATACVAAPFPDEAAGLTDGAECEADEDCKSGACGKGSRLCTHSLCDCPGDTCTKGGEPSPDCASGWTCVYYETVFGDIGEVFNIDRDYDGGYCRPLCSAGCPEHYICKDGTFCTPNSNWADPSVVLDWTGAAEGSTDAAERLTSVPIEYGKPVVVRATAKSPLDLPVETYTWTLVYGTGRREMMDGRMVSFTLEDGESGGRVEITVRDSEGRSGMDSVSFKGCRGTGGLCGYEGSGCCAGCDKDSNTCR